MEFVGSNVGLAADDAGIALEVRLGEIITGGIPLVDTRRAVTDVEITGRGVYEFRIGIEVPRTRVTA